MNVRSLNCPKCGAPLPLGPQQSAALCLYCNSSLKVAAQPGQAQPQVSTQDVPPEVGEQVKRLVADGKTAEAIRYYQSHTGLDAAEAEAAVKRMALFLAQQLTRQHPLNAGGIVVPLVIIAASGAAAVWGLVQAAAQAQARGGWLLLALGGAGLAVLTVRWFIPKLYSTVISTRGPLARARVVKRAIVRPELRAGGTLVTLLLEVCPAGQPSFQDEETILVRNQSLEKLQPGQVIEVRYHAASGRVFPTSPIRAWDEAAGQFV